MKSRSLLSPGGMKGETGEDEVEATLGIVQLISELELDQTKLNLDNHLPDRVEVELRHNGEILPQPSPANLTTSAPIGFNQVQQCSLQDIGCAEASRRKLRVHLLRAEHLPQMDGLLRGGKADPYVTLDIADQKPQVSEIRKNTLNPTWNEIFNFDCIGVCDDNCEMVLTVKDYDFMAQAEVIGQVRLKLSEMLRAPSSAVRRHILDKNGLHLFGKDGQKSMLTLSWNLHEHDEKPRAEGLVDVTILSALHLPKMDMMGSVDGFVNLTFQGEAFQTSVQKNTYSPVWGETFTVQVARIQDAGELELALWDWNATTADKFVAQVRISAPEMVAILRGTPGKKILRREELLDKESQVVVGRDGQPAEIFLSLRPFVRITSTESFRRGLECAELSLTKDKLDKQKGVAETHGERCDVSHLGYVRKRGQKNPAFKQRFFVLDQRCLKYYKTQADMQAHKPSLGEMSCYGLKAHKVKHSPRHFIVICKQGRVMECEVEEDSQRDDWVVKIDEAAAVAEETVHTIRSNKVRISSALKAPGSMSAQRLSLMEDLCRNSRFVHAQLWYFRPQKEILEYTGEHFTCSSLSSETDKVTDLLAIDEATPISVWDDATVEGLAWKHLLRTKNKEETFELEAFISNPEIILSERVLKLAELFYSSMVVPVEDPRFTKGNQDVLGVLVLFAPHENSSADVRIYQQRATNIKLFRLIDDVLALISYTMLWDSRFIKYKEGTDDFNYDIRERVRKLWSKLRVFVRSGWIRHLPNASSTPPLLNSLSKVRQFLMTYVQKFRGANGKAPPRADTFFAFWTFLGVFTSLLTLSAIDEYGFKIDDAIPYSILYASFAALATLLFAAPASPFAQPKLVIGGHVLSSMIAVIVDYFVSSKFVTAFLPSWVANALTPALAISSMTLAGCINPPAAAVALIYTMGDERIKSYGWMWLLLPSLVGSSIMIIIAILTNNLSSKRKYPQFWY